MADALSINSLLPLLLTPLSPLGGQGSNSLASDLAFGLAAPQIQRDEASLSSLGTLMSRVSVFQAQTQDLAAAVAPQGGATLDGQAVQQSLQSFLNAYNSLQDQLAAGTEDPTTFALSTQLSNSLQQGVLSTDTGGPLATLANLGVSMQVQATNPLTGQTANHLVLDAATLQSALTANPINAQGTLSQLTQGLASINDAANLSLASTQASVERQLSLDALLSLNNGPLSLFDSSLLGSTTTTSNLTSQATLSQTTLLAIDASLLNATFTDSLLNDTGQNVDLFA